MAHAIYEPLAGLVRAAQGVGKLAYGESYRWAASVRWLDRETAEVLGLQTDTESPKGPTHDEWEAVIACLKTQGATQVIYYQYRDGKFLRTRRRKVS